MVGKFSTKTSISSFEVDKSRNLRPSAILMLMQEVAGQHLESEGYSYEVMRSKGFVFLLVKEAVSINRLPHCRDEVKLATWFEKTKGAEFLRAMQITDEKGLLIEAQTYWIIADPETHKILRPTALPFEMPCLGTDSVKTKARKIKVENGVDAGVREVRYSDIDCNNHMNNSVYADIVCDYFPNGLGDKSLSQFQINFEGEATLGEKINIKTASADGGVVFEGTIDGRKCFLAYAAAD